MTVSISSSDTYSNMEMYKNGNVIARSEISSDDLSHWGSGTASSVAFLKPGDTMSVHCNYNKELSKYSYMTMVKIK